MQNVVVIGGGTGTFVVLSGLKDYPMHISAVVTIMDSGGSTGRLRDQYGVVPPGDLRQCLVALSDAPKLWRKLFLYRFEKGDFKGHNFGNILLTALEQIAPNYQEVIDTAEYILQTKGDVIPVTFDKVHLCAEYEDGEILETEELIDTAFHKKSRIKKVYLKPKAHANNNALKAIKQADYIILGPGDVFTSIIPNLVVNGIKDQLVHSKAKIIYIVNLMTKQGQTTNFTATDHIEVMESYLGRKIDVVLMNNTNISRDARGYYEEFGEKIVNDDLQKMDGKTIIRTDLIAKGPFKKSIADKVNRSLQRHDSKKLAMTLSDIINS